ncbi:TolC family outer membrane protein [Simiduia aestuariiviva]|uniref:Outer membrane protein n=1 Tax=Simiduia aestuariiviva TaxID=1510459 RepID=A0A839UWJ8_9GAMM|nr:TolC family outer membrane protein [Simiduia aestuariiviva]MBB3169705.1 outer membrane protein [Simiduia aestuariiviva]
MKGLFRAVAALAFVFSCTAVQAQEGLVETLAKAKQADPSFLGAGFQRAAEQEAIAKARAKLLPSLSFAVDETRNNDRILESENQVADSSKASYDTTTFTLALNQSIYNHEHWVRYGQSKLIAQRADIDFDKARQDMLMSVAERYFTVLKTEEQLAAIGAEKEALSRQVEYATKSRKAGIGRKSEVEDAEARYFTALAEEAQFIKALDDARYELLKMTNELPTNLRPIQEQIPLTLPEPTDPQQWINTGLTKNPDVLSQQTALKEAKKEISAQNAGHFPTLDLTYRQFTEDQGGSLFGGASKIKSDEVALRLEIPIYQGGGVSASKREAIERMYKTQEDLHRVMRSVQTDVNSAYQGVIANIAQIKALEKTVKSQRSVLMNKQRGHQAGIYTMLVVLDAQRDLADAERNYIEARYDYVINSLKLKRAAGVLVEDDLQHINAWLK